jgi:large subunit ribosomal protein L24
MAKTKIKKGDNVLVISGRERGKTGKVVKILGTANKVLIERLNMVKRHQKPQGQNPGGIIEQEAAIDLSNVMLVCPKTNVPTRIGRKRLDNGKSIRVARVSGATIES